MSSEQISVADYEPIPLGWLKVLPILLVVLVLVAADVLYFRRHQVTEEGFVVFLGVNIVLLLLLNLLPKKLLTFVVGYFKRNIRGYVAYFFVDEAKVPQVSMIFFPIITGANRVVWKCPLGGWLRRKPAVMIYSETPAGWQWKDASWHWKIFTIYGFAMQHWTMVVLQDHQGNALVMTLSKALSFLEECNDPRDQNLSRAFRAFQIVEPLTQLVESAISEIEATKRFGNSISGRVLKKRLDAELSGLVPQRKRIYLDV